MNYKYKGAKSLVLLHEEHIKKFFKTWQRAKNLNICLPKTEDLDYRNLDTLLRHVFRSAGRYMIWMCEKLNLPNPNIPEDLEVFESIEEAENYLEKLLIKWRHPLSDVSEEECYPQTFTSRWGVEYCIDAMLEHAVMHPIRHEFQLNQLIIEQDK